MDCFNVVLVLPGSGRTLRSGVPKQLLALSMLDRFRCIGGPQRTSPYMQLDGVTQIIFIIYYN